MKLKEGDKVLIKRTGKEGVIIGIRYNPYRILPKWMSSPTYLVKELPSVVPFTGPHCLTRKDLKLLK